MLKLAVAAALAVPGVALAGPLSSAPPASFSGCYAGIIGGYAVSGRSSKDNQLNIRGTLINTESNRIPIKGGVVGGDLGCNFQRSSFVLGPEVELWYHDVGGTSDLHNPVPSMGETLRSSVRSSLAGAASLRLGYVVHNVLFYAKGGIVVTSFKHDGFIFVDGTTLALDRTSNVSNNSVGYLAGVGTEMALSRHVSAKLEYNYVDFGSVNLPYRLDLDFAAASPIIASGSSTSREFEHLIKAGIAYRF